MQLQIKGLMITFIINKNIISCYHYWCYQYLYQN